MSFITNRPLRENHHLLIIRNLSFYVFNERYIFQTLRTKIETYVNSSETLCELAN